MPKRNAAPAGARSQTARQSWKQKLAMRMVQSSAGRWTLKTISRIAAPAEGSTNTLSLVAGILGIVSIATLLFIPILPLVTAITALVLGIVGLGQANKKSEGGKGWAITGIICGSLTILLYLLVVVIIAAVLL